MARSLGVDNYDVILILILHSCFMITVLNSLSILSILSQPITALVSCKSIFVSVSSSTSTR